MIDAGEHVTGAGGGDGSTAPPDRGASGRPSASAEGKTVIGPGGASAQAIYGTVLTLAVIVGVSEDLSAPASLYLEAVATSAVVFWATHVYAGALAAGLRAPQRRWATVLRVTAGEELPLLTAPLLPALLLALGALDVLGRHAAIGLALGVGVAELFAAGVAAGRAGGGGWRQAITAGVLYAALGGVLVGLKALTAH